MDIKTLKEFWDCECETNYIHPITDKKCSKCGALREEQPNTRLDEFRAFFSDATINSSISTRRVVDIQLPDGNVYSLLDNRDFNLESFDIEEAIQKGILTVNEE
ncbi:MAG: hypothetical protein ACP6IQ_01975 [Candidatus Njordarchaeia archaeon]